MAPLVRDNIFEIIQLALYHYFFAKFDWIKQSDH